MPKHVLDHAALRITDLTRSREFYEELLGLTPVSRPDFGFPGAWYGPGHSQLHLIEREASGATGPDPTSAHFAIEVDDLSGLRQRLVDAGYEIVEFGDQMWVRDPDGYTVELRRPGAMR
ncbi:MAG: VOC family protein [Deltaproteobacteria bacterium]|nr:VOC family protein [Deltaproteobacteria bacterium]